MATDAAAPRLPAEEAASNRSAARGAALAVLALLMGVSALLRFWAGRRVPSPWYVDEFVYASSARSIAANWHLLVDNFADGFYLYPRLIAPAWAADSPRHAYDIAKAINVGLMTFAAVPVYLWSRRLLTVPLSLVAAALVLVLPTGLYSAMLVTENAFFPAFLLALYAIAAAIERPRVLNQLLALGAVALASAIRLQGIVLVFVYLAAIVVEAFIELRQGDGGSFSGAARRRLRVFAPTLGFLAAAAIVYGVRQLVAGGGATGGLGVYSGAVTVHYSFANAVRWIVYHAGALVLATGVVPFSALVLLVGDVFARGRASTRAERAFVAVGAPGALFVLLQVGVFASRRAERIDERYMFHVVPIFLIGLLLWLLRGAYRPRGALVFATALPVALLVAFPVSTLIAEPGSASDTFTIVALGRLRSHLAAPDDLGILIAVAVGGVALAVAFMPRKTLLVVAPAALVLWFGYASVAVAHSLRASSEGALAGTRLGGAAGWVDAALGRDADVTVLDTVAADQATDNALTLLETYFWNRSVKRLASVNPPGVCCLPQEAAVVDAANGAIDAGVRSPFVLALPDLGLDGRLVARNAGMGLYRLAGAPRLGSLTTGVYADGWMGRTAAFQQFAPLSPSVTRIVVSVTRTAWAGKSPTSVVRVRLLSRGRQIGAMRTTIASGVARLLTFPAPPSPFTVAVDVSPTFAPSAYGGTDTRQLGAQVAFSLASRTAG